jgi:hypothetical protein
MEREIPSKVQLDKLPPDTLRKIASKLPLDAIDDLCNTSKRFREIICDNEAFWKDLLRRDFPKANFSAIPTGYASNIYRYKVLKQDVEENSHILNAREYEKDPILKSIEDEQKQLQERIRILESEFYDRLNDIQNEIAEDKYEMENYIGVTGYFDKDQIIEISADSDLYERLQNVTNRSNSSNLIRAAPKIFPKNFKFKSRDLVLVKREGDENPSLGFWIWEEDRNTWVDKFTLDPEGPIQLPPLARDMMSPTEIWAYYGIGQE